MSVDGLSLPAVMFLDGRQPVKYGLKLEMDEKYKQLKEELSELCEVPSSRLLLVEMYASNIRVSWWVWLGVAIEAQKPIFKLFILNK